MVFLIKRKYREVEELELNKKIIALTGGAGSGKSFVSEIIRNVFGYTVIDSDITARKLMEKGKPVYNEVIRAFGNDYTEEGGNIDRKRLAETVFNSSEKLEKLNAITHPAVIEEIKHIADADDGEFVFVESAIALTSGYCDFCDLIWMVWAEKETRMRRLKETRSYTDEKINSLFESQPQDKIVKEASDAIIYNPFDCKRENIIKQIRILLKEAEV